MNGPGACFQLGRVLERQRGEMHVAHQVAAGPGVVDQLAKHGQHGER